MSSRKWNHVVLFLRCSLAKNKHITSIPAAIRDPPSPTLEASNSGRSDPVVSPGKGRKITQMSTGFLQFHAGFPPLHYMLCSPKQGGSIAILSIGVWTLWSLAGWVFFPEDLGRSGWNTIPSAIMEMDIWIHLAFWRQTYLWGTHFQCLRLLEKKTDFDQIGKA